MTEQLSITQMAETDRASDPEKVTIEHLENPRVEAEAHYYNVVHTGWSSSAWNRTCCRTP